ncbi:MAG TPA: DUF1573 domain-containing protein [Holophagaceae bacterium]|nr:DUF1573 domain-containing protein [Holophagaceae bacterium]
MLRPAFLVAPALFALGLQAQAPEIAFDRTHHAFGKITAERKASTRFKVTNKGNANLQISAVNPSCGCTSTVLGNWNLKPGESSDIEAVFDPHGQRGLVRKSLTVVSNDPKQPDALLTFEAEVVQDVMPALSAVYFNQVSRAGTQVTNVRYASGTGLDVRILEAKAPGAPWLRLTPKTDGKDAVLEVALDGSKLPAKPRFGRETVTLTTNVPSAQTFTLPVNWELKPSIVGPDRVNLDVVKAGTEGRVKLQLKQAEGKPFRITGTQVSRTELVVDGLSGTKALAQHDLAIVLSKSAKPGRYAEKVTISTDDPEQPEIIIRVTAVVE